VNAKSIFDKAAAWVAVILGFILGRTIGLVGVLLLYLPIGIGIWVANKYSTKIKNNVLTTLVWANLVAWIIPFIGLFIGTITSTLLVNGKVDKKYKNLVENLSVFGIIFSLSNGALGTIHSLASNPPAYSYGRFAQHLILFAVGIYILWFAIRIHFDRKYKSNFQKVLLGSATFFMLWIGVAVCMGVGEAWSTSSSSNNKSSDSTGSLTENNSKAEYWKSFQSACETEALKNSGVTSENASSYCGCMVNGLQENFTPAQAENGGNDPTSKFSTTVNNLRPGCAESAGLVLQ